MRFAHLDVCTLLLLALMITAAMIKLDKYPFLERFYSPQEVRVFDLATNGMRAVVCRFSVAAKKVGAALGAIFRPVNFRRTTCHA